MTRKYDLTRPRTTSLTVAVLDAELVKEFQQIGEPLYLTFSRIMREYSGNELVEKVRLRLEEAQKKLLARSRKSGHQVSLIQEQEQDEQQQQTEIKDFTKRPEFIHKFDYIKQLQREKLSTFEQAHNEVTRRLKQGRIAERYGLIQVISE